MIAIMIAVQAELVWRRAQPLLVGRPICQAADPAKVAKEYLAAIS